MVAHMSGDLLIARAVSPVVEIVHHVKPDQLDSPTPCTEFDVRALINHLLFWGPSLEAAGRKETLPPPAEFESAVDLAAGDWAADLAAQLDRIAAAWAVPAAWQGTTCMGSPAEMPAGTIGGMVMTEIVVHGWDLAEGTGQQPSWDRDVLAFVHREVDANAQLGRDMGLYGPQVPIPAGASLLDRILGLTGRRP
jgi:uncharacterized protein (TIGR03086 family)